LTTDYEPPDGDYYQDYPYHRRGISLKGIIAIGVFAVLSFYAALVTTSPLYAIVLPGNENFLGGIQVVNPVTKPEDKDQAETIEERINILFLGLDRRFDEAEDQPYRTDSVMVLTIDPYSKTAGALSIPRDTRVEVQTEDGAYYMETRINTVYEMGEYNINGFPSGYPGGGPGLAMDTVEKNFGIQIDHWVLMDWTDFVDIINTLGGVDIDVPEYAYDPIYSTCAHCGEEYSVEFLPGPEHMDGDRALAYARIRHSDNDFKRVERQQLVLKAMARKASSVETIINNPIALYNQFHDAVQTDVSTLRAGGLAVLLKQVGMDNLRTISLAPALFPCDPYECGNAAEQDFDPGIAAQLIAQVFNDSQLQNENATISVLNCTPLDNMASAFQDVLLINGVSPTNITTDEFVDGKIFETTILIDRTGTKSHTVGEVADWLGIQNSRIITASDPAAAQFLVGNAATSDIVVVLGSDIEVDFNGDFTVNDPQTALPQ
jgi:LCP family protein required for cell wall assembly